MNQANNAFTLDEQFKNKYNMDSATSLPQITYIPQCFLSIKQQRRLQEVTPWNYDWQLEHWRITSKRFPRNTPGYTTTPRNAVGWRQDAPAPVEGTPKSWLRKKAAPAFPN